MGFFLVFFFLTGKALSLPIDELHCENAPCLCLHAVMALMCDARDEQTLIL